MELNKIQELVLAIKKADPKQVPTTGNNFYWLRYKSKTHTLTLQHPRMKGGVKNMKAYIYEGDKFYKMLKNTDISIKSIRVMFEYYIISREIREETNFGKKLVKKIVEVEGDNNETL